MSQRTIDTVLRVQNESGYKSALRNCTAELKVQKTELERVTSEYRTNANSMEALTKKGDVLFRMYDTQQQKIELLREAMAQAQNTRDTERETLASLRDQYDQAQKKLAALKEQVDETSQEFQEQKAAVDELRDSVIQHQAKLDASTKSYSYYAAQLNKAEVELDNLGDKQDEVTQLLNEAKSSADGCATSIDKYGDAVRESAEASEQSGSAVEAMAQAMVASGVQQKVEELAAELMEASEAAQNFEVSMAQVGTIADSSVLSKDKLKEGALTLSTDLRKDAEEVSAAMYDALSAGVETADVLNFTAQSSQLATAGFTDMSTSVDVLTTILNAYKLKSSETEKVASTLVKTQDLGKITVDDLGKVMGRVIPTAAAYGVDLNNIATAYANMTAAGVNAENTTTNLTAMLDELADGGSDVAVILAEQTGKTFSELMNEGNSLADVLEIIGASVEYDQVQFSNLWSSSTAGKAAISLFDGSAQAFNATLEQMINSSGTVAKNYEKMTDTSEYSSQRMEVASKNLQIAVGDSLNPVLDELRESGGAVLEKATEIVRQNPALVSVITGTVTALGLLAAGVSGLMAVKSVTTAMQALNITMAANPAVLVTTALVGLAAATATYLARVESTEERVESLTEASRGLSETVDAGKTSYEDTMLSAQAAADTVSGYIDRLAELEAQGELTDIQQAEYSILLEKISSLMPGINMELDAQTGLLKGGTEALQKQADAWKKAAVEEAAYARYKDDIDALADAEYELAKNQALLNMAQDEAADITARYNDAQRQMEENLQGIQDICDDTTLSYEEQQAAINALADKNMELELNLHDMRMALAENAKDQKVYTKAVEQSSQALASAKPQIEAATAAYEQLSQTTQEAAVNTGTAATDMADSISEAALEAQAAYDEMYLSALSRLSALDISRQNLGLETFRMGQRVSAESAPHKLSGFYDLVAMEEDLLSPGAGSITLTKDAAYYTGTSGSLTGSVSSQNKELQDKPGAALIQSMIVTLTATILGAKGGAVRLLDTDGDGLQDTLYIGDNADPAKAEKVWRFNYEGWATSKSGYNGPFIMGATIKDGLLAASVTAANLVAGCIKSKDGKTFYLDLDNGVLKMQATEFFISAKGQTYLRPTYEDCMNMLWSLNNPANFPPKDFYDLNGDGAFTITDVLLALNVCYGKEDISKCVSLNKSTVSITIDPSNPLETLEIAGVNMWGSEVKVSFGANKTAIPVIAGDCVIGGALSVNESAEITKLAVSVGGAAKTLSWKDNGDGTFTLIGQ